MTFGPMQLLVVGFDDPRFTGEILPELRRLREHDVVRLVDLLFVTKARDGSVATMETSDLSPDEAAELGAVAAALVGLEDSGNGAGEPAVPDPPLEEAMWFIADAIPSGTSAAVAVLEHRWAIPLRDAITNAGGKPLADEWLHPSDLAELGPAFARAAAGAA
jgi:hypothetical protein